MKIKTIKKSIGINAPKQRVWEGLQNDDDTRKWYALFKEGTYAETDWQEGNKVIFKDADGNGMIGRIAASKPYELLDIEFDGFLVNGKEDFESEGARASKGTHETYRISENNGTTMLEISSDVGEDWYEGMSEAWDKALKVLKELAEQNQ